MPVIKQSTRRDRKEAGKQAMCSQLFCLPSSWLTTQLPGLSPLWPTALFLVPHHPVSFSTEHVPQSIPVRAGPGMAWGGDEAEEIS